MFGIIGIVTVFVMVFGGYLAAGGKFGIIIKALPFEMMMIGGAAVGAATASLVLLALGVGGALFLGGPDPAPSADLRTSANASAVTAERVPFNESETAQLSPPETHDEWHERYNRLHDAYLGAPYDLATIKARKLFRAVDPDGDLIAEAMG